MENLQTRNPKHGQVLNAYEPTRPEEFEDRIRSSYWRFQSWKKESVKDRVGLLTNLAELLRTEKERLAELITNEMGKPISQSRQEIEKCAWLCEYYRDKGPEFLKDEHVVTGKRESFIAYQPLGPILCVMPWNFPFWQVFRFAVPAITAGNTVLLKHAHNTMGCALEIHDLFARANYPDFTFQTLVVGHEAVENILARDEVVAVSVTGSEQTGRQIAELAGRHLKKTVLELGGSDPYVVLGDADIDHAVEVCLKARLVNSGQSCIAAKRLIVSDSVYDEFAKRFVKAAEKVKVGDPSDPETEVGPLAREDLLEQLERQVQESLQKGAQLLFGGERLKQDGFYYAVTVLGGVEPGMPAFDEETFGPVAALVRAKDDEEAIELANRSRYGLGAAIFTESVDDGRRIARERLESGVCAINSQVQSDPRLPFGGVKHSGYGRELGEFGLREFVNIKTVYRDGRLH